MDAFVITLRENDYSRRVAQRCRDSANIPVHTWTAVDRDHAQHHMQLHHLKWTWGRGYKGMTHKPYGGDHWARIGCFLSHYMLWRRCFHTGKELLILEHDAVFVRPFKSFDYDNICMINDPRGATPKGDWWSEQMAQRGPGTRSKTKVFDDSRPDGLAGNSAYLIKPHAAGKLCNLVAEIGAWPNDAIMCRQLLGEDYLQEHYPFITEVRPERSTIQ